jgi:hypothetical protein
MTHRASVAITSNDLNRGLRNTLWPALKIQGFAERTERVAWRRVDGDIDVVKVQVVGQQADAVGCPPMSFSAYVACYPRFLVGTDQSVPAQQGGLRPHYWHCDPFNRAMDKTIEQPWFRPFGGPRPRSMLPSLRLHREGLMRVLRRDVHDRPDIWYVREDGSNLDEDVRDMTGAVLSGGLAFLSSMHDPVGVLNLLERGEIGNPDSPRSFYLSETIREYLSREADAAMPHAGDEVTDGG